MGRGKQLRELRIEALVLRRREGGGEEEDEQEAATAMLQLNIGYFMAAFTQPLTCSPFLQVLELRGCHLRGAQLLCLTPALSSASSSLASLAAEGHYASSGAGLWPFLRELRLSSCEMRAEDVATLMLGLEGEGGREGGRGGEGGGGRGSGTSLRALDVSGKEGLGEEGCMAVWLGLRGGACPCLVGLGVEKVGMTDEAMRVGLIHAVVGRRRWQR